MQTSQIKIMKPKIDAVIVTYNRLNKLKKAIESYEKQTISLRNLIIINNASDDGTREYLDQWKEKKNNFTKYVINLPENIGGSGGFNVGQELALTLNSDWVFIADDDAYPERSLIEKFQNLVSTKDFRDYAAISILVRNSDNTVALDHRQFFNIKKLIPKRISSKVSDYGKEEFECDLISYVGTFINSNALKTVGTCRKDYFIYGDDTEHSIRLTKYGKIACIPSIEIYHDCGMNENRSDKYDWRSFYGVRNTINLLLLNNKKFAAFSYGAKVILSRIKRRDYKGLELAYKAIKNGINNKLGIDPVYCPQKASSNKK